ncbi:MAG: trypsin-like serine protease [Chthoniobacterales bacterium]
MKLSRTLFFSFLVLTLPHAGAVVNLSNSTYNTSEPTNSDIPNWTTGWGGPAGTTGWDYVGIVNSGSGGAASGTYLKNQWVITAAHVVTATSFTLGGTLYNIEAGSVHTFTNPDTSQADIVLFRLTLAPNLPDLVISSSAPVPFSNINAGSKVVMIGFGDGGSKSTEAWGYNTVTANNVTVSLAPYTTTDFETAYGTTSSTFNGSVTNNYTLRDGDSGGGDFIFNGSTWNLAGINEAVDLNNNNSYMVQLSNYKSQIDAVTAVPEPSTYWLIGLGALVLVGPSLKRGKIRL